MRICKVESCNKIHFGLGYCNTHYVRFKRHGSASDSMVKSKTIHGMKNTPEYGVWHNMKSRCYNPNNNRYSHYGGRGITICDRWLHSFINFINDMGRKPFLKAEIDRIDNDKGYYNANCRWTTKLQNMRHTTRTKLTIEKANKIRDLYKANIFTNVELGKIYKVSPKNIYFVVRNITWRNNLDSTILYGIK